MSEPKITVRAANDSGQGNLVPTRVVIHSTVGGGFPGASASGMAHSVAEYFARPSTGGSAHYVVDDANEEHCVPEDTIAWHAPPNEHSLGIEIASEPTFTREQWLDDRVWPAVEKAAARANDLCDRYKIPKVKLSVADLLAGKHGICGHVDVSQAWHQSTHWDPGPNFPWDKFMELLSGAQPVPQPGPSPVPPPSPATPPRLVWPFGKGGYVGDIKGPAASHGGFYPSEQPFVRNVQQWLIYHDCTSVPASSWQNSGWADGKFQAPYSTQAARIWHNRFYSGQPYPEQIWADDYDRLARP